MESAVTTTLSPMEICEDESQNAAFRTTAVEDVSPMSVDQSALDSDTTSAASFHDIEAVRAEYQAAKAKYLMLKNALQQYAGSSVGVISEKGLDSAEIGDQNVTEKEQKLDRETAVQHMAPAQPKKRRGWLATGSVMLFDLQQPMRDSRIPLSRSISFSSRASKQFRDKASPKGKSVDLESKVSARCELAAIEVNETKQESTVEKTVHALLQLDAVQSEQLARSLKMRAEAAAESSRRAVHSGKPSRLHAAGFGQSKETVRGPMDTVASSIMKTMGTSLTAIKDARILPELRRDFARAVSLVTDYDASVVAAESYMTKMSESVRLFKEVRESLHGVISECTAGLVEAVGHMATVAARSPNELLPSTLRETPANRTTSREVVSSLFECFQTAVWKKVVAVVAKELGEAVRLNIRSRAFIAQLENRLHQLHESTFADRVSVVDGPAWRTVGDAMTAYSGGGEAPYLPASVAPRPRLNSVVSAMYSTAGTGKPDENPIAATAKRLAEEDLSLVQGSFMRVARYRASIAIDPDKARPVAETMVAVSEIGGVRSPAHLRSQAITALSPASPLLVATAVPAFPASGREPPFDPVVPGPLQDVTVEVDAIEFIRYTDAFPALIASPVPAAPAVSDEDVLTADSTGDRDMMSAMILEHNIEVDTVRKIVTDQLWLIWRHALLRYGFETRQRAHDGLRDIWTSLVCPPRRKTEAFSVTRLQAEHVYDLSAGTSDRLLLDTHLAVTLYRLLEAVSLTHLFPIS